MYPHLLSYNNYPTSVPRSGYGYYSEPATRSLNPRDRYFNALVEARAAEEEMLAEAAVRREEELLQRRLNELRQSCLPQYSSYPLESYYDAPPRRPSNDHLESLRLQVEEEERQLAKLEAVRRRRLELEEEQRLGREIEEKLMICGRPAAFETPEVTTDPYSRHNIRSGCPFYPEIANRSCGKVLRQKKPELLVRPPSEETRSVRLPIDQVELLRKSQPAPRRKQQPSTSNQIGELDSLLQQLGLSLSTVENHPHEAKTSQQTKAPNVQPPNATPKKTSAPRDPTTSHTSPIPVPDFEQLLNLLTGIGQDPQQEQKKQSSLLAPEVPRPKSPQTTLKEDLEKRLDNEHANEARDTIQAILNSLQPQPTPTSARQPSVPTPSGSTKKVPASPVSSDKGKSKEIPVARVELKSSSPKDATERVQAIENRFHTLESEFAFPVKLDFVPTPSNITSTQATSYLAYTANNQPFRFYQQSLTHLLTQLDSIESFGNEELRNKRKEVVRKVEHALEDLEQEVEGRWNAKVARESKKHNVTIEDVTLQEEELDTSEPTSAPQVVEKEESQAAPSTLVPSAPVPSQYTEELAAPSLPEQSETGAAEEPVIAEPSEVTSDTPAISQENSTLEPEETVVEDKAAEAVGVEETQSQPPNAPEPEATEQSTEEPSTVTLQSIKPTGPAATPAPSDIPTPVESSEADLSATIRPLTPVIEDAPESDETESLNPEGETKENETDDDGGFLLQNGPVEEKSLKLDFSDVESNASDWSEVDVALAH